MTELRSESLGDELVRRPSQQQGDVLESPIRMTQARNPALERLQETEVSSPVRNGEGRVRLKTPVSPKFRVKADGQFILVASASPQRLDALVPQSPTVDPPRARYFDGPSTPEGVSPKDLDDGFSLRRRDLRQIRSRQAARRVSDIMSRISQMREGMENALLEKSLTVQAHDRVVRKLDVVIHMLETLVQDVKKGKDMSLVQRDRHDAMLYRTATEALTISYEAASEGGGLIHSLRNIVVDTREWLDHVEDEVERVSQGTVVLAMADASELQPLFEALYSQWCWRHGSIGRFFKAWRLLCDGLLSIRDKRAMENIVKKIQTVTVGSLSKSFAAWIAALKKKFHRIQVKTKMILSNMFSDKVWAFRKWRTHFLQSLRSRNILDKIEFRSQLLCMEQWSQCYLMKKRREQKRRIAERMGFKKLCEVRYHAWANDIVRNKILEVKLQSARAALGFKRLSVSFKRWAARQKTMIYRRREVQKARRSWLIMQLGLWKRATELLCHQKKQSSLIVQRTLIRSAEEALQNWCDAIEIHIIQRLRMDNFRSKTRNIILSGIFRRWKRTANITQSGVISYKIKRTFQRLQRQAQISRTVKQIFARWNTLSETVALENCFRKMKSWFEARCDALDILAKVAHEVGVLELDTVFMRWRRKETKHRMKRFRQKFLRNRQRLGTLNFMFCFWVRKTLDKGQPVAAEYKLAMRLCHKRRKINLCRVSLFAFALHRRQMVSLRHSISAVSFRTRRRRMKLVLEGWEVLMKKKDVVHRMRNRLARRSAITWIRLFSRIAHEQRIRIMYGQYCTECKRPWGSDKAHANHTHQPSLQRGGGGGERGSKGGGERGGALENSSAWNTLHQHKPTPPLSPSRPASSGGRTEKSRRKSMAQRSIDTSERREYRPASESVSPSLPARPSGPGSGPKKGWSNMASEMSIEIGEELMMDHDIPSYPDPARDSDLLQDQVSNALALAHDELESFSSPKKPREVGKAGYSSRHNLSVSDAWTHASLVHRNPSAAHTTVLEARQKWHRELRVAHKQSTRERSPARATRPHSETWEELKGGLKIGLRHSMVAPAISDALLQTSPFARSRPKSAYASTSGNGVGPKARELKRYDPWLGVEVSTVAWSMSDASAA